MYQNIFCTSIISLGVLLYKTKTNSTDNTIGSSLRKIVKLDLLTSKYYQYLVQHLIIMSFLSQLQLQYLDLIRFCLSFT